MKILSDHNIEGQAAMLWDTLVTERRIKTMNKKAADQVKAFIESVNNFFADVESWIVSSSLKSIRQEIEISEEYSGSYKVSKLILQDESGKKIAELIPVGAFIIGGKGRIDMNGTIDKAIIVNLDAGGQSATTTITVGNRSETSKTAFYKCIDKQGWYWIENGRRGKANFLNNDLFIELLQEVSDYEFG